MKSIIGFVLVSVPFFAVTANSIWKIGWRKTFFDWLVVAVVVACICLGLALITSD